MGLNVEVSWIDCPKCGLYFGTTDHWMARRKQDHETFYCPNGHAQSFPNTDPKEKVEDLKEAVTRAEASAGRAQDLLVEERVKVKKLEEKIKVLGDELIQERRRGWE